MRRRMNDKAWEWTSWIAARGARMRLGKEEAKGEDEVGNVEAHGGCNRRAPRYVKPSSNPTPITR